MAPNQVDEYDPFADVDGFLAAQPKQPQHIKSNQDLKPEHRAAVYPLITELIQKKNPTAVLRSADARGFFKHVFAGGWDTSWSPPVPKKPRLETSSIMVGHWNQDLPFTGASRDPARKKGQPAYLTVAAVPMCNTLEYKAMDARGHLANLEYIDWGNAEGRLSDKDTRDLCRNADAAYLDHVNSWNRDVTVYKARNLLRASVLGLPVNPLTPSSARALMRAARDEQLGGSPQSAKRKRQDAEDSFSLLGYDGRPWPILERQKEITAGIETHVDAEQEKGESSNFDW